MNTDLLFVVPVPLDAGSLHTGTAGCAVGTESTERYLNCRHMPHRSMSPAYLLQQHINPFNCDGGMTSFDLCTELNSLTKDLLGGENSVLVSFAPRHLGCMTGLFLQNMFESSPFDGFKKYLSVKTALETCRFFGNTVLQNCRNLNESAKETGFAEKTDTPLQRLKALKHLYYILQTRDPKILSFLTENREQAAERISKMQYAVHIDEKGQLCLIKILNITDGRFISAAADTGTQIKRINIDLYNSPLIAPTSILTSQRQQALRFNLALAEERLYKACEEMPEETEVNKDEIIVYKEKLSSHELALMKKLQQFGKDMQQLSRGADGRYNVAALQAPTAEEIRQCSADFQLHATAFLYENCRNLQDPEILQLYADRTESIQQHILKKALSTLQKLHDRVDANNKEELKLLQLTGRYYGVEL